MADEMRLAGPRFNIREATKADIPGMAEVFFHSFNAPFWVYLTPPDEARTKWWHDSFNISLDNPTDKSFVAEDTSNDNRIVAFSRWMVPQADGNQERKWPELDPNVWDMDLCGAFFGGMEESREHLMGKRPHWMLELLGVHEDYQKYGIGASLIKWGTEQADKDGLETYLDASEVARPYYIKRHAFAEAHEIPIPDHPAYGHYPYASLIRPPQK